MAKKSSAILTVNRGLYLDRPAIALPPGAMQDCMNVRVKEGQITNLNMGWSRFGTWTLNGPVMMIANFINRVGEEQLIFATKTDLYKYVSASSVRFITPIYSTGTVEVSGTTVTGSGTSWSTNAQAGDQISFGAADEDDPAATWYEIDTVGGNTSITLTADAGTIAAGEAYTIRRLFTGTFSNHWDHATFLNAPGNVDLWFATNGIEEVVKWSGTGAAEYVTFGGDYRAKHLAVFQNMLILGNITVSSVEYPTSIANSQPGTPESLSGGLAGQFLVHGGSDAINDLQNLGDNLVVYSERTGVLVQFVGDPTVFVFRRTFTESGPLGVHLVANFGDHHEFVGQDTQYKFDGAVLSEINNHLWREVVVNRDAERVKVIGFHHFDEENAELIWAVPLNSDEVASGDDVPVNVAWTEHYLEDVGPNFPTPFTKREFPFTSAGVFKQQTALTWATATDTWATISFRWGDQFFFASYPLNLVGAVDGKVYTLSTSQTKDGTALEAFAQFGRIALGDGRSRGLLRRVYPFANSPNNGAFDLDVTLWRSESARGAATESDPFPFNIENTEGEHFVSTFRRSRFVELEFGTTAADEVWALAGYDVDVSTGGRR